MLNNTPPFALLVSLSRTKGFLQTWYSWEHQRKMVSRQSDGVTLSMWNKDKILLSESTWLIKVLEWWRKDILINMNKSSQKLNKADKMPYSWTLTGLCHVNDLCKDHLGEKCDFAHTSSLLTSTDQGRKWFIWFMSHSSSDWWCKFQLINKLRQILALVWGASGGNVLRTSFPSIFDVSIILAGSCWCLYAFDTHTHT